MGHPTLSCQTLRRQAPPAPAPAAPLLWDSVLWGVFSNLLSFPAGLQRVPEERVTGAHAGASEGSVTRKPRLRGRHAPFLCSPESRARFPCASHMTSRQEGHRSPSSAMTDNPL